MIQKKEILENLEKTLLVLENALSERERALRGVLSACNVSKAEDIEERDLYMSAFELQDQIETLTDLVKDIKYSFKWIGSFEKV